MPNAAEKEWVVVVVPKDESYQIYSDTQAVPRTVTTKAIDTVLRFVRAYIKQQVFTS